MFPKISDLINFIFGSHLNLPFQTYGFMMSLAFLAGGFVLRSELKRKDREGLLAGRTRESQSSGSSNHLQDEADGRIIHPYEHTWSILIVAIISAIVGSKLFDILDNFDNFLKHPWHSLFSIDGFAFLGGLIVTVVVLIFYMRVIRLDWKQVIDCTAPVIMIGYAVGRLGCHLAGDGCWGTINNWPLPHCLSRMPDWLWACKYPHNVINSGIAIPGCSGIHCRILAEPVYPTSLYESLFSFVSFGILWSLRRKIKAPVVLFGLFMVLHGTGRLLIEQIRINNKYSLLGTEFSQAELISAMLIVTGAFVMICFRNRYKRLLHPG